MDDGAEKSKLSNTPATPPPLSTVSGREERNGVGADGEALQRWDAGTKQAPETRDGVHTAQQNFDLTLVPMDAL